MYTAVEVSKYVINYSHEINHPISNLKLQKLLYYIQAASLVELGEKCFQERIIAWEFGPVVEETYQLFKEYGRSTIPQQNALAKMVFDSKKMKIVMHRAEDISRSQKEIIEKVVDAYKNILNPFELVKKTHQEDPWKNTNINQEIECSLIEKFYRRNPEKLYV